MKKFLLSSGVLSAAIGCTLAFAVSGQKPKSINSSQSHVSSMATNAKVDKNLTIDPNSLALSLSAMPASQNAPARENASGTETITEDLWASASQIYCFNSGSYSASTNTLTFTGDNNNEIFAGVTSDGNYFEWIALSGAEYTFSGHLSSDTEADVRVSIIYRWDSTLYISASSPVSLNKDNGQAADFSVSTNTLPAGAPVLVAFLLTDCDASMNFTSTDNKFTCTYNAAAAAEWTPENDLPGLGLNADYAGRAYTIKCDDGVTTVGLLLDDNNQLNVTGMNTTSPEVFLPENIQIDGKSHRLYALGMLDMERYQNVMDWSGAASVKKLHLGSAYYLNIDLSDSPLTDLYIGNNFYFDDNLTGCSAIYLHAPHSLYSYRNVMNEYGFKRVLIGEETPDYPESDSSLWIIAGQNEGDYFGININDNYYAIYEIFTDKDSVTLPVATPYNEDYYYIRSFGDDNGWSHEILCANAPNLKSVTIPDSYQSLYTYWSSNPIRELHMKGPKPYTYWTLPSNMTVYIGNQEYYNDYENDSSWASATLVPEGWDFDWLIVNVNRPGEFAQTYFELTDADWSAAMLVKVTGNLNTTDLENIKNLTNLRKLDLSEARFDKLPNSFMQYKRNLQEIILPADLETVPEEAFYGCSRLIKVTAPGLKSVETNAFGDCQRLTECDLSKVENIGSYAFQGCSDFAPVIPQSILSIGSGAFINTAIKEVHLPEAITAIEDGVFYGCSQLEEITLPQGLKSIGYEAFEECRSLSGVNLPEGLSYIGTDAFRNCSALREITLPSSLVSLGAYTFNDCTNLETVKCKAVTPPIAGSNFTSGIDLTHCALYVASFSIDAYRDADYWNNFYIMKPLDEPIDNIVIFRNITFDLQTEDNAVLQDKPNLSLHYNYSNYNSYIGQLTVKGTGTLSAGVFEQYHILAPRRSNSYQNYRTSLINEADNMRADSVVSTFRCEPNIWHFITFPYDVKVSDIAGWNNTDFAIRSYNGQNRASGDGTVSNWEDVPADGILEAGKGYILQCANNTHDGNGYSFYPIIEFPSRNTVSKNRLFTSDNVIVALEEYPSEFAHNRSWNLVGNPYPCYYDMHYVGEGFCAPIILWRGNNYQAYSPIDDDIILRPNESFFVQRPLDSEKIVFDKAGRMHHDEAANTPGTPGITYAPQYSAGDAERSVFNFIVKDDTDDDRARIVINENASMDYEQARDAAKFFAENPKGIEIFVNGNVRYNICERPLDNGQAVLGIKTANAGTYTLSLTGRDTEGWVVTLTDTKTGQTVDLSSGAYVFEAEAGMDPDRFVLTFRKPVDVAVEDILDTVNDTSVKVMTTSGLHVFEGSLRDFRNSAEAGVYIIVTSDKAFKTVVK